MDTQETVMGIDAREVCQKLRDAERMAIAQRNWDQYYLIHGIRLGIARTYFSHLFFSQRVS